MAIAPVTPRSESLTAPIQPYGQLPGSNGVVPGQEKIWSDAEIVFPTYDGATNRLPATPPNFGSATATDFLNWHSAYQAEYLATDAPNPPRYPQAPSLRSTTQVPNEPSGQLTVHYKDFGNGDVFVLSQDKTRVFRIASMTYEEVAKLSIEDQRALAGLTIFKNNVAIPMGLRPTGNETVSAVRTEMGGLVDTVINQIKAAVPDNLETPAQRNRFMSDPSSRVELAHFLFLEQLELYKTKFQGMAVFKKDEIAKDINAIAERFARFQRYSTFAAEGTPTGGGLTPNVNAVDGGATVGTAVGILLRTETTLYNMALQKAYIVATGTNLASADIINKSFDTANNTYLSASQAMANARAGVVTNTAPAVTSVVGQPLDGPMMIFFLQNYNSQEREAEADAKAEELNQSNRLLQDYSLMQKMLNDTLKQFNPTNADPNETKTLLGASTATQLNTALSGTHPNGYKVASMFDTSANATNVGHPIEVEKGIVRPTQNLGSTTGSGLVAHKRSSWDAFASNLGDMTRTLGQDSQIRMEEIAQLNKQKNRSFDLGSNTLNKMTELLRSMTEF